MAFAGTKKKRKTKKSSKPKAPPGQKVSGKHVFQGKKSSKSFVEPKGKESPNIDPGFKRALKTHTPPKQPTPDTTNRNEQYYKNLGITDQRQLAAQSMMDAGITNLSGYTGGQFGNQAAGIQQAAGFTPVNIQAGNLPPPDKDDDDKTITTTTTDDEEEKTQEELKKQKALKTAKELTEWWAKHSKDNDLYEHYRERKNILTGKLWGSQEAVTAKLQDKLNKGYYKIVQGPEGEPLIIHASTGTPVNPYTGNIISTQTSQDQGGAYQNEMARITGIAPENAGVFSKEYQTGNGLAVENMKPEHALRFLMKKNSKAFEEFFQMNKGKKDFNPFSVSAIGSAMGAVLNMITGPEALQVGNNLEKAGWGKAIENKDGSYSIKLTKTGAENWSKSFNVPDYVSPEAVTKDKDKGWLSEILGTKKFPDQPIDLTNLIGQGGYFQGSEFTGLPPGTVMTPQEQAQLGGSSSMMMPNKNFGALDPNLNPEVPFSNKYSYPTIPGATGTTGGPVGMGVDPVTGAPIQTGTTSYPQFTPEGYKIGAYNPTRDYSGRTSQTQTGDGSGGGDDDDDTTTQGPLSFNVFGKPNINYDYTGGPEQIQLGGGWMRDGQYINSPWGGPYYAKDGGIANFKPYGY
jgi:hypothetical protein